MLSFPAVFVRGAFLGSFEQLRDAISTGRLNILISAPIQTFPANASALHDPVKLLVGPRGQPWYCFQLHVFGNFVRVLSALHVVLFVIMLAVYDAAPGLAKGILCVMGVDLVIFTLFGPTPVAPICTLVTFLSWRIRGNAVTSLPYKAVIGFAYVIGILGALTCTNLMGKAPDSCSTSAKATIGTMLVNSIFLALFRF